MRILVADDHPLVRDALARTVTSLDAVVQVIEAADFDALRSQASEHDLDLALVDLNMPGMRGVNGLRALRREFPTLVLIVASAQDDAATIRMVLATGVSGFIPKTESRDVVLLTHDGAAAAPAHGSNGPAETTLTPRQIDVLGCLLQGRPNKLIARDLGLTEGTVKIHIAAILRALGASNRTEAVVRAREMGLLQG